MLDLFSCSGAATVGYQRAGFTVVGVDKDPQPNYPRSATFVQADAIEYAAQFAHLYDFVHASPPCQSETALTKGTNQGREYPKLIGPIREALLKAGVPFVIENVQGASVRRDLMLCGDMFEGLEVIRHRLFELHGVTVAQPRHGRHRGRVRGWRHGTYYPGPYVAVYGEGGGKGSVPEWQRAMGITHTSVRREIAEALPPAYTEYIGRAVRLQLEARRPASAPGRAAA
ncbi:DNA methylase [Embleya sp. NPDC005971]|uniref:DNA methylase n=1 Tax=Embleya sp. NPDC005971 TaxID=3156724 RepID=UPI003402EBA2